MAMTNQSAIWGGCVVVALGIGALTYYYHQPAVPGPVVKPLVKTLADDAIQNPVPEPTVAQALPALDDSDAILQSEFISLLGQPFVQQYLLPKSGVRHMVATIDNLPRKKLAAKMNTVMPMAGQIGDTTMLEITLSPAEFARYDAFVQSLTAVDSQQLVTTYFKLYPLFQEAYRSLGYPTGYFNDRLVKVLDHLIATPYLSQPIALTGGPGIYQFADPALEALSAGQKIMIRMGPDNSARVRSKLKEIRVLIAAKGSDKSA